MNLPYTRSEKIAGLFLVAGLTAIIIAIVLVGGGSDWFRSYDTYFAKYSEGYGLSPGDKVKFLQTDIGRVTQLELTDNNTVMVHMIILREYGDKIKKDSRADIAKANFVGASHIDIIPGSNSASVIPVGGIIPSRNPQTISEILASLQLEDKLKKFNEILANITSLTNQLQDPKGPFLGTMANVKDITGMVSSGKGSLGKVIVENELYEELNKILTTLDNTSVKLNKSVPELMDKINGIANKLEEATRSAPDISRSAREGLRDANQVLDSVKRNILIRGNLPPETKPAPISGSVRDQKNGHK